MRSEITCPDCNAQIVVSDDDIPEMGPLRERIRRLLERDTEVYHTVSSIADVLGAPESSVLGILRSMLVSREIDAVKHGPAVIYEHDDSGYLLRALDHHRAPIPAYELISELGEEKDKMAAQENLELLAILVKEGKVTRVEGEPVTRLSIRDGKADFVLEPDQGWYRSVPVTIWE